MKSFPFMVTTGGPYVLKSGDIIPGKEPGERLKVTKISDIQLDAFGGTLTVFGRCRHLKEGEGTK